MAQKSSLKNRPERRKVKDLPNPSELPTFDETAEEELTGAEKFLATIQPHITTIALLGLAIVLGIIAAGMWTSAAFQNDAIKWQEYTQSSFVDQQTQDTNNLEDVAERYPNDKAGLFSALLAGDIQLRKGLGLISRDREAAVVALERAKNNLQVVANADPLVSSTMLTRRAQYCLAYTHESLGELDKAKTLYQEFVDQAPDSPLFKAAQQGLERCSDSAMAELYNTFVNFEEEVIGEAPGPLVPEKVMPSEFPEIDAAPGVVPPAGDETDTEMNDGSSVKEEAKDEEAKDEEAKDEEAKDEEAKDEEAKDEEAKKEEAKKEEAKKEEAKKEEAKEEDPANVSDSDASDPPADDGPQGEDQAETDSQADDKGNGK